MVSNVRRLTDVRDGITFLHDRLLVRTSATNSAAILRIEAADPVRGQRIPANPDVPRRDIMTARGPPKPVFPWRISTVVRQGTAAKWFGG